MARYLFGDSTPFPLQTNFIVTLQALIDAAVALLQLDQVVEQVGAHVNAAQATAEEDLRGLAALGSAVLGALDAHDASGQRAADEQLRLKQSTAEALDRAQREVGARREAAIGEARSRAAAARQQVPGVLETFLLHHELPNTVWGVRWRADLESGLARAQGTAAAASGVQAEFELEIDSAQPWARAVKVSDLKPSLSVQLPGKRDKPQKLRLERYLLTEASIGPKRGELTLRKALKAGAPGVMISFDQQGAPVARRVDDPVNDTATHLDGIEGSELAELYEQCAAALRPLVVDRAALTSMIVGRVPVAEVEQPGTLARLLISLVAPLVVEIVKRSPVPGELALKREVGDGRREELFISVATLTEKLEPLSDDNRSLFDAFALTRFPRDRRVFATGPLQPVRPAQPAAGAGPTDEVPTRGDAGESSPKVEVNLEDLD